MARKREGVAKKDARVVRLSMLCEMDCAGMAFWRMVTSDKRLSPQELSVECHFVKDGDKR